MTLWPHILWALIALGCWHHGYDRARERTNREWLEQAELEHQATKNHKETVA